MRSEPDVTGLITHRSIGFGEVLVVRQDVVVQRVPVPPDASIYLTEGELCVPGTTLAASDPDPSYRPAASPRPSTTTLVADWLGSRDGWDLPGERLGRLVKLLGDDRRSVLECAPADAVKALVEVGRRTADVQSQHLLSSASIGQDSIWAGDLADQRCRFRFQRGLRVAATL